MDAAVTVRAPFTNVETDSLNGYQRSGAGHPFTCGNDECRGPGGRPARAVLNATPAGWACPSCHYTQDWAWSFMTDFAWKQPGPWALIVLTSAR